MKVDTYFRINRQFGRFFGNTYQSESVYTGANRTGGIQAMTMDEMDLYYGIEKDFFKED